MQTWILVALLSAVELGARTIDDTPNEFRFQGRIGAGKVLEVEGWNGDVVAGPSRTGEVEVIALKSSGDGSHSEVRISVTDHARGMRVRAMSGQSEKTVKFLVRVPAGVHFAGRTRNGGIHARGLRGRVEARTVNGDIEVAATGLTMASTVNGSIRARVGAGHLETVNGNVTVQVRGDAVIDARTVHGVVKGTGRVCVQGSRRRVEVRTVSGDIVLEAAGRITNDSVEWN